MSDYETTQRRRNIIVGIFVISALCALGAMVFKFRDLPGFIGKLNSFAVEVQFPTAPGVQKDTPVRFCGYRIGRVTKVEPPDVMEDLKTGQSYHQTLVVLSINNDHNDIPADVEAKLMTRGLSSSYIELKPTSFDAYEPNGPFLNEKSRLQGSTGRAIEFIPEEIQEKLVALVDGLRTFVKNANDIVGDPNNKKNLQRTLANLSEATNQATQTLKEFQEFSAAGTTTFKNADAKIEEFVTAAVDMSEELSKATAQLRLILEKINTGPGTAARFVNDGKFYESMLENSEQMQLLLEKWTAFIDDVNKKGRLPIKLK